MRIIIAGGTGFIGAYLKKRFEEQGDLVKIISRDNNHIPWVHDRLVEELEQTDLLINLAGRSINCRHTPENKKQILQSRLESTALLGNAAAACKILRYYGSMQALRLFINQAKGLFLSNNLPSWQLTF